VASPTDIYETDDFFVVAMDIAGVAPDGFAVTFEEGILSVSGEITLRGNVLPVGGIKEKLIAAARSGIGLGMMSVRRCPCAPVREEEVKRVLEIRLVSTSDEVLNAAPVGRGRAA
jgi:ATP-dependent Lon protease